jgi:DNA polymerase III subunit epsilon
MSTAKNRQIVLDTETTGMNMLGVHYEGHRIIEIGAVEVINRRMTGNNFHVYLQPDRLVDPDAFAVHGISDEFLQDKPNFAAVADEFIDYIRGAELIIHNASFDIGFMDYEFSMLKRNLAKTETFCQITDTLLMARKMFPGKRNSLDALCQRYAIDNSKRLLHGALLDAEILGDVYLAMTGGQTLLAFNQESTSPNADKKNSLTTRVQPVSGLKVIKANANELAAHDEILDKIEKKAGHSLWRDKKPD